MDVNASADVARVHPLHAMRGPVATSSAAASAPACATKSAAAAMDETITLIAHEQLRAAKRVDLFKLKKLKSHRRTDAMVPIDEVLDVDLLSVCLSFLDFASLSSCECVSSHWHALLNIPRLWKQLYCDRWRSGRLLTLSQADRNALLPHFKRICRQRVHASRVALSTRARTWMRASGNVFVHNDSMELRDFGLGCTESVRTESALKPLGLFSLSSPPVCCYYFEATIAGCGSVGFASISSAAERKNYGFGSDYHLGWYPVSYGYHGDDGMFYWNAGRRSPAALGGMHRSFGPRWGDTTPFRVRSAATTTVGCGFLDVENARCEVFYTLNGALVSVAPVPLDPTRAFAAAVSLHQFGDSAELNFGSAAFAFDIEQFAWGKQQVSRAKEHEESEGESDDDNGMTMDAEAAAA